MFLKASRLKLRWNSSRGFLSLEDLWDLSLQNLNTLAKGLKRELKAELEEDFLEEKTEEDTITKLKFDIVIEVLNIKKSEAKAASEATAMKAHNQKILGLIAKKQDEDLEKMSVEDLQKLLK